MRTLHSWMIAAVATLALAGRPALAHSSGSLVVVNERSEPIEVRIDRTEWEEVDPLEQEEVRVPTGRHVVELVAPNGKVLKSAELSIQSGRTARLVAEAPESRLVLDNHSGTTLGIEVDGQPMISLRPNEEETLVLAAGRHDIRATYHQLGEARTLVDKRLNLPEDGSRRLGLDPAAETLLRVVNETGRTATLRIDGVDKMNLKPGQAQTVGVRLGHVLVELVTEGRIVFRADTHPERYAENIVVAEAITGELALHNPLPFPVEITIPGAMRQRIDRGETAIVRDLEPGLRTVQVRRSSGELLVELRVDIDAGEREWAQVPVPDSAVVRFDSDSKRTTKVYVNDRLVATLAPHAERELAVHTGSPRITIRDERGQVLLERRLDLEAYERELVQWQDPRSTASLHDRHHHAEEGHSRPSRH